jgi:mono/diheme cytochrome c family protein
VKRKLIATIVAIAGTGAFTLLAQAPKSQWDGVYTVEQAARGEKLYQAKCINCHGKDLYGFSPDMNLGPALVDTEFTTLWDDATLGDLFTKIHTQMPRAEPGTLSEQEAADLLSYILSRGKYPAGTTELPPNAETLNTYKFLAKKPAAE